MYAYRNIKMRSSSYFCSGITTNVTYSECVCVCVYVRVYVRV